LFDVWEKYQNSHIIKAREGIVIYPQTYNYENSYEPELPGSGPPVKPCPEADI
jgi:hypothetical protein